MKVTWTHRQKQVIDLHNRNLLVAAAAGSGKTAVLVERIIQMVLDKDHPIDVDRLLVVTFTRAAAAEMKERIGKALEEALASDPDNVHLQMQPTLLHNAHISTIDSFCLHVVRNHFYKIDLDPGFRQGDEQELALLREDVLKETMEAAYVSAEPDFLELVRAYGNTKNDHNIVDMVRRMYAYADSYPWPQEWLEQCRQMYQCKDAAELEDSPWIAGLIGYVKGLTADMIRSLQMHMGKLEPTLILQKDLDLLRSDLNVLMSLLQYETYEQWSQGLSEVTFRGLERVVKADTQGLSDGEILTVKELHEYVKNVHNKVKEEVQKLRKNYFSDSLEEQAEIIKKQQPMMEVLLRLVEDFSLRYSQAKEKKNLVDFPDVAHMALEILVDPVTKAPTAIAREYQEQFYEVMVDEYQDSNYIQEALLTAVCGGHQNGHNMFMVGDVKQSIYRFRLARPELFMDKYSSFTTADSENQRIDLHHNFRSRSEVLDFANDIFFAIMQKDVGGVAYDEEAALHAGGNRENGNPEDCQPEVLVIDGTDPDTKSDIREQGRAAFEARVVAQRIRQMTTKNHDGQVRWSYKDITILVPTITGFGEVFAQVFAEEGIPLISSSKTGYFAAVEVQTMIQLLKVLNNPRQDLALAGVLRSVLGNCCDTELAQIKAAYPNHTFHEAVLAWRELTGEESARIVMEKIADSQQVIAIHEKITRFFDYIDGVRQQLNDTPIHEVIQNIYRDTGYLQYVSALPAGQRRSANLDKLLEMAIAYENTSYQGLFDFVRYLEKILFYEQEYGEAEVVSEQGNAIQLMTIHKSKGLEFPVVFVCGMGKQFNMQDLNEPLLFHSQYGAGFHYMDRQHRIKRKSLARQTFGLLEKQELLGEEMRLLYVALTRARDKLILTGISQTEEENMEELGSEGTLSFGQRVGASCFWDWVLPVISGKDVQCQYVQISSRDLDWMGLKHQLSQREAREKLLLQLQQVDEEALKLLQEQLEWTYPHAVSNLVKQKVSVSELKHRYMDQQELEEAAFLHKEPEVMPYLPRFADRVEEENAGALRGTAMHRYLECFDFAALQGVTYDQIAELVKQQLGTMCQSGRLSEDLKNRLSLSQLAAFLQTVEAREMAAAAGQGNLYRERPFMMSVPATEIWPELAEEAVAEMSKDKVPTGTASSQETVLVQGIVDVFWVDSDGITLLDYKTDNVSEPKELLRRYELQLHLYAQALSRVFDNCKIKNVLIYSFKFGKMVYCNSSEYFQ